MEKAKTWDEYVEEVRRLLQDLWTRDKERYEHVMAVLTAFLKNS